MKIHTCFITHDRLEVSKRAIASYLETVSAPFTFVVVDNRSRDGTREWLLQQDWNISLLDRNRYPGFACNRGWERAPADADFLHRADNDFTYRDGWCEEVAERFQDPELGQLGLLTDSEEAFAPMNVGGNCVIRRELWDKGLRYDERPWTELDRGYSEDSYFSPAVVEMGYIWGRVQRTCIDGLTSPHPKDPYSRRTYRDRGILDILKHIKT